MIIPAQLRAARALLDWSPETMAARSGTSAALIDLFEKGAYDTPLTAVEKWVAACDAAGVIFVPGKVFSGPGVQFKGQTH
jgi:hypothetical protein